MSLGELQPCPGCGESLPASTGPTHRYIGASPACWAIFTALTSGGEPPLAPSPMNLLIVDAYAAQHPGKPSTQAIQSVAVHTLVLRGVFEAGVAAQHALWIRRRALRARRGAKHEPYEWLEPPDLTRSITIADVAQGPTPQSRTDLAGDFVRGVWECWSRRHGERLAEWYDLYVLPD
ncbi:MAG TPA: DUF5946 family protein [Anaerolineales bacterium]|nr:DUF5946 family protein [Anaerolineales bacterium]